MKLKVALKDQTVYVQFATQTTSCRKECASSRTALTGKTIPASYAMRASLSPKENAFNLLESLYAKADLILFTLYQIICNKNML